PQHQKSYQNKLALIVEDNPQFLALLETLCGLRGIPVATAVDAQRALKRLQTKPYPDLLLVDIGLGPGMNGLELCRKVKDDPQTKHIPVILMTGTLEEQAADELAKKAGADLFTVKPMEPYELCFQMERFLK
ncbi:MAG: response regulator, partial [Elusimicrobia bacterium]|nr:response regulator [Elusimicrobiota bacterium]